MNNQVGAIPSPCINVCRMDGASGLCEGCLRTIDEIAAWGGLADEGRRSVLERLDERRRLAPPSPILAADTAENPR